jgi:hypothetical protein
MRRRVFLAVLPAAAAGARELGPERILTDSPWARPVTLPVEIRKQGFLPVRTEIHLTVRWSSALPVRKALEAEGYPAADPGNEYVIEIFGIPTTVVHQDAVKLREGFEKAATLTIRGQRPVAVSSVEVPGHGLFLAATLRFPRFAEVSPDAAVIELQAESGPILLRLKFKPREMVYKGRLEL